MSVVNTFLTPGYETLYEFTLNGNTYSVVRTKDGYSVWRNIGFNTIIRETEDEYSFNNALHSFVEDYILNIKISI